MSKSPRKKVIKARNLRRSQERRGFLRFRIIWTQSIPPAPREWQAALLKLFYGEVNTTQIGPNLYRHIFTPRHHGISFGKKQMGIVSDPQS